MSDTKTSGESTGIIPREKLTAYERWELASFDTHSGGKHQFNARNTSVPDSGQNLLRQQEHDRNYALKSEEGYAAGMQQAQADTRQINAVLQNLQGALNQIDAQVAQSLLDLSLEVARQMVREALQVKPEIILKVVSEAIGNLPHFNQSPHLILHPDDAELVRTQMGEQLPHANWKIFTDPQIQRGGCRVETAHSNVDATNEVRWQQIVASIGQDKSWLSR
jgi:flagellar assembly protein FliH